MAAPSHMTDDFDFEFDLDRGRSSSGTRARDRGENGDDEGGNGAEPLELDLFDERGEDAAGEEEHERGNGGNGARGYIERARRLLNRRPPSLFPEHEQWSEERASSDEASFFDDAFADEPVAAADSGSAADLLEPPADQNGPPAEEVEDEPVGRIPSPEPLASDDVDEDWLGGPEDGDGAGPIEAPAESDLSPRPPTTEGRELARQARKRATQPSPFVEEAFQEDAEQRRRRLDEDVDFEDLLEHQPQKSGVARRGSAVLYGLRGLVEGGRERLVDARYRFEELRARIPLRPGSSGTRQPPKLPTRVRSGRPRRRKPGQVKVLRVAIVVVGLGALALASTIFGMVMAVARDIPNLESKVQYAEAKNSEVFDAEGRKIGTLLSNNQRRLIESEDISPYMKEAAVAIEDERFYEHRGVDYQAIGRAFFAGLIPGGSTQGASTITQQFVKNALEAQGSRTYFQKLREASIAYHLERQWDKDKILTEYLNTIYFGEGAYGIEAAARTYFGNQPHHQGCGEAGADKCASELLPHEAALLAAIISAPGAYSPRANPEAATNQRNVVLAKMKDQGILSEEQYQESAAEAVPAASDIEKPDDDSLAPYFTSWLRQAIVDKYGAGKAFGGGLDIHTTLDLDMQEVAESVAYDSLAGIAPTASVVVLDNETGAVKALVGGNNYEEEPFNLATNGARQPGSAMKPFVLAAYLKAGGSPSDTFTSAKKDWIVPNSAGLEHFPVENYEDNYFGTLDVATATKYSDNSVFTEMGLGAPPRGTGGPLGGIREGPKKISELAEAMGIGVGGGKVDRVPAITLGAPSIGFTPLEFTYAYNAIAHGGERVGGSLDVCPGNKSLEDLCPVAMDKIVAPDGDVEEKNEMKTWRVLPEEVADTTEELLHGPVSSGGTGQDAQTPGDEWGKTGTTENHGDAWFCGGTEHLTACVWVGHAMTNKPMETEYAGSPVAGGTYPAQIWGSIMTDLEGIYEERQAEREAESEDEEDDDSDNETSDYEGGPLPSSSGSYSGGGGSSGGGSSGSGGGGGGSGQSAPAPAPSGGGGGGSAGGTGGTGL
jgi:penicillin-binding protein 1A